MKPRKDDIAFLCLKDSFREIIRESEQQMKNRNLKKQEKKKEPGTDIKEKVTRLTVFQHPRNKRKKAIHYGTDRSGNK